MLGRLVVVIAEPNIEVGLLIGATYDGARSDQNLSMLVVWKSF